MKKTHRRKLAALTAGVITAVTAVSSTVSAASYLVGDMTLDGYISATDAVYLQRMILGMEESTPLLEILGDANGDGGVNVADVVAIRRYIINHNYSPRVGTEYNDSSLNSYDIECTGYSSVDLYFKGTTGENVSANLSYKDGSTQQWSTTSINGVVDENGYLFYVFQIPYNTTDINIEVENFTLDNYVLNGNYVVTTTVTDIPIATETTTSVSYEEETTTTTTTVPASEQLTLDDVPAEYEYALDWIWETRILGEKSTARFNTLFDQIVAGDGTLNYVIRWQSYKDITLEQRQKLEGILDEAVNGWTDYLVGYDGWEYDHIDVNIVGWAVLDANNILDPQPDEIIYDNLIEPYDSTYDTSNGYETIPDKLPSAPDELSRFYHFSSGIGYDYPGGLDKRFDMYLWATEGFPNIGGCGGDWGQRLSDSAYLNIIDSGFGVHVLQHELGHGFGITDFYGGEGESDGFPPGGFPNENKNSLMMAGSSSEITDFDGWMLRYMWSNIKDEAGRF